MIKANELRLGNWVSNGEKNYTVDACSLYDTATLEYYPIEGILLTPEILEKCGFKGNANKAIKIKNGFDLVVDVFDWFAVINPKNYSSCYTVDCKYLHQLQNLYFALTGTELEINL